MAAQASTLRPMYASALNRTCRVGFTVVHLPPVAEPVVLAPFRSSDECHAPRERPAEADPAAD
ncbi:hypothetical protein GCM10009661_15390 [Catellatospora chokoriensis]